MKKFLFIVIYCLSLSSCSTLFTKKNCFVKINSDIPNSKIKIKDSVYTIPAKISLKRSKEKLSVVLFNDSISKKYVLKPSVSPNFIFGNLFFLDIWPLAYGVDFTNQKRFYYKKVINLNSKLQDSIIRTNVEQNARRIANYFTKEYPKQKGQINLMVNPGSFNFITYKPENEVVENYFTVLNVKFGVDYFYKEKNFVSVDIKALSSFFDFGYRFDPYERKYINSIMLSFTNNHVLNRFSFGYGINSGVNIWKKEFINYEPSQNTITKTNYTAGLKGNVYYQLNSRLFLGINYDNSFFQIYPKSKIVLNQNINFELLIKFKKKRKNKD